MLSMTYNSKNTDVWKDDFLSDFFSPMTKKFLFTLISRIFSDISVVFCTTKIKNKEGTFSPSFLIPFSPFSSSLLFFVKIEFSETLGTLWLRQKLLFWGFRNRIRNWEWRRINSSLFLVSTISPFSLYLVWDNNQGSFIPIEMEKNEDELCENQKIKIEDILAK